MSTRRKSFKPSCKTKGFFLDYDGTLFDSRDSAYGHDTAIGLLIEILNKRRVLAVITARDASFRAHVLPSLQRKSQLGGVPFYFAVGNGSSLYRYNTREECMYSHELNLEAVFEIVDKYSQIITNLGIKHLDLRPKGVETFSNFLKPESPLLEYLRPELIALSNEYKGAFFAESSKISFVLPAESEKQAVFISEINRSLGKDYSVKGDREFVHVSRSILKSGSQIDGKLLAVKTILKAEALSRHEAVAFGDSPFGNDQYMLAFLPHSYTNDLGYSGSTSPVTLTGDGSPVAKVHQAIRGLL